ncbi:MAG: leucyl/phenylalanyl-tRNA--protein transferase [Chitinophagaceae bacterium]|nr:leucyl/phenylalanyl-tRNA--protein transferase [Chitinophagaceae bacterium]
MPIYALDNNLWFPPVQEADSEGLLAMGGDLSVDRLLLAYKRGIFPWFEGDTPLWWCPNPRFVLFPNEIVISTSMRSIIKKRNFRFTVNKAFPEVIRACKDLKRKDQEGTWITNALEESFVQLHELGFVHSAEAWQDNKLVGGLYGVKMGKVFFGESMFSTVSNASKFAFISFVEELKKEGIQIIDCQVYTAHLESLGAKMIARESFINLLNQHI